MEAVLYNLLMIVLCVFFIVLCNLCGYTLKNTVQIQNVVWLIAFVIYLFDFVEYYDINHKVYLCAASYLITYNIVYLSGHKVNTRFCNIDYKNTMPSKTIVNRCIHASVLMWILSIGILQKSIPLLLQGQGMNILRYTMYGSEGLFSTYEMMLIMYIMRPVFIVTIIVCAIGFALRKNNAKLLIVSLIDALMVVLMTAGRTMMVTFVIYIVITVVAINGLRIYKILTKYMRYLVLFLIVLVLFLNISMQRINNGNGVIEEIVRYYFSSLPYFSELINEDLANSFTLLGTGTFSALVDPILLVLSVFGIDTALGSQGVSNITSTVLLVGENLNMNATASTLLPFYLDFGIVGTILGGIVVARFAKQCEKSLERDISCLTFAVYIFLLQAALTSIQNYALAGESTFFTLVFMFFMLREKKITKLSRMYNL